MLAPMDSSADRSAAPSATAAEGPAFDAFLASVATRAYRFAEGSLRHRDDAMDAVQDAMARMLDYRHRPAAEWTPLFWSIVRSRIVDVQRRGLFRLRWLAPQSEPGEVEWGDHWADPGPGPQGHHDAREAWTTLVGALRELPRRQREAFQLRVLEELDVATTARVMGCGEGAVKTHLSRARDALKRHLEDFQ
jgi:RNA polymerase sigma-70 factor (ECF subfamily)